MSIQVQGSGYKITRSGENDQHSPLITYQQTQQTPSGAGQVPRLELNNVQIVGFGSQNHVITGVDAEVENDVYDALT